MTPTVKSLTRRKVFKVTFDESYVPTNVIETKIFKKPKENKIKMNEKHQL